LRTSWLVLGCALCAFAAVADSPDSLARMLTGALCSGCLICSSSRSIIILAIILGAVGAWRLGDRPLPPTQDPSAESLLAVQLSTAVVDGRAQGWACGESGVPVRARFSGLDERVLNPGARLIIRGRRRDLLRRATPDRRDPWRAASARRVETGVAVREVLKVLDAGRPSLLDRWRNAWTRSLEQRLGASAGLWRALVLADGSTLDTRARRRVQSLGMAHLLALSGMHTSIVALAILWPWRRRGRRALVGALPVLAVWVVLAGGGASLMRAAGMAVWWVVARRQARRSDVVDALAAVALLELSWRPHVLCGVGWWLSYAATLAVVRGAVLTRAWPRPIAAIGISVAAQLATAPWVLDAFGFLSLAAPLTLLLVAPVFAACLVGGLSALTIGGVFPMVGRWIDPLVVLASHAFGGVLELVSWTSGFVFRHPGLDGGGWVAALLMSACALWPARVRWRVRAPAIAALILAVHLVPRNDHEWIVFDVGQGDGMVLRCGRAFLVIDTGPRYAERSPAGWTLVDYLARRDADEIKVVITHGHLDHFGGLAELLATGRVGELLVAGVDSSRPWVRRAFLAASRTGVATRFVDATDLIDVDHCRVEVLWPQPDAGTLSSNDRSLVLAWSTPAGPVLATGDLERAGEGRLLTDIPLPASATFLKVAHHGGNTGTDEVWLERLRPAHAFVSSGAGNRYGHPDPAALGRVQASGARIHRTDRCGFLRVRWRRDGDSVQLDCGRSP
jgi:competence protein ComEC